jgi:glycerophosphoryl diester phosphodiesterase
VQQRLPRLIDYPITFGHRGAKAYAAENTLDGFELGLKLGASGLESDAWVTADGIVVLDHDGLVRLPLRRRRSIGELRRAELPAYIPTLGELFARCGSDFHLSLDLKDEACGTAILDTVRNQAPAMIDRLWLCHPSVRLLSELRTIDADVKLVNSTRLKDIKRGPEARAATLADLKIDAINLHYTDWTGGLTTLFHRFNRLAFSWDLQHEHQLVDAFRMGIDAVYSDFPDRMVDALSASGTVASGD